MSDDVPTVSNGAIVGGIGFADAEIGDCLISNDPTSISLVNCSESHDAEIFAFHEPTDAQLAQQDADGYMGIDQCSFEELADYMGRSPDDIADVGPGGAYQDGRIVCLATSSDGSQLSTSIRSDG